MPKEFPKDKIDRLQKLNVISQMSCSLSVNFNEQLVRYAEILIQLIINASIYNVGQETNGDATHPNIPLFMEWCWNLVG